MKTLSIRNMMLSLMVALLAVTMPFTVMASGGHHDDDDGRKCINLTVNEIVAALDKGKLTSEECMRSFLRRIHRLDPIDEPMVVTDFAGLQLFEGYNAYVFLNPNAMKQARKADRLRRYGLSKPLLGVPIAIKDSIPAIGLNNSSGNFGLIPYQPTVNAPVVQRLLDAGAIIIGQNNMHEVGLGSTSINFAFGPARNAHDPTRFAGGSSGGGAAAVALKMAPAALGSDIGGSVRHPPALNGIIGFRPSYSRYSLAHFISVFPNSEPLDDSMAVQGIIARSIDDAVLLDQVISDDGGGSITTRKNLKGIRLGVPEVFYEDLEPDVIPVVEKALKKLEAKGATLVRTPSIPNLDPIGAPLGLLGPMITLDDVYSNRLILIDVLSGEQWSIDSGILVINNSPDVIAAKGLFLSLVDSMFPNRADARSFYDFLLLLTESARIGYRDYFDNHQLDAIIYPTAKLTAQGIEDVVVNGGDPFANGFFDFTLTLSDGSIAGVTAIVSQNSMLSPYFGTPSLSMPVGLTKDSRLPVGMQIESLAGDDARVLEIGSAFEKIFGMDIPNVDDAD